MEKSEKELLEALSKKSELFNDLKKLWKDGDANKITAFIEKAGIKTNIETVEKALAEFQKKTVEKIRNGKIDDSQLESVVGGGDGVLGGNGICDGTANCDDLFLKIPCIPIKARCKFFLSCDETFGGSLT